MCIIAHSLGDIFIQDEPNGPWNSLVACLVQRGLARVVGMQPNLLELVYAEAQAQEAGKGYWEQQQAVCDGVLVGKVSAIPACRTSPMALVR